METSLHPEQSSLLEQKVARMAEEIERLRTALEEERTARINAETSMQAAMEGQELQLQQLEAKVKTALLQGRSSDATASGDLSVSDVSTRDVTEVTDKAGGDLASSEGPLAPAPRAANIYYLDTDLLKLVLSKLECRHMFQARQVCKRWRSAIDSIVDDCRRDNADRLNRDSAPVSDLHLVILAQKHPDMTTLRAPSHQSETDLRLVASTCLGLQKADLRGFKLRTSALRRLAAANASTLQEVTLPTGVSEWQLERLLEPLTELKDLYLSTPADATGRWVRHLTKSLRKLDVTGPGVSREPKVLRMQPDHGLAVIIRQAPDAVLDQLSVLAPHVTKLSIFECLNVTAGGLWQLLGAFTSLEDITLGGGLDGAVHEKILSVLYGCSQLQKMQLGEAKCIYTDISAAAVSRLTVACRKLRLLFIFSTPENSQSVLDALLSTDLGNDGDGWPRTLELSVPPVYEQMKKPPYDSSIKLSSS